MNKINYGSVFTILQIFENGEEEIETFKISPKPNLEVNPKEISIQSNIGKSVEEKSIGDIYEFQIERETVYGIVIALDDKKIDVNNGRMILKKEIDRIEKLKNKYKSNQSMLIKESTQDRITEQPTNNITIDRNTIVTIETTSELISTKRKYILSDQPIKNLKGRLLLVSSPLGQALLGKKVGDKFEYIDNGKKTIITVLELTKVIDFEENDLTKKEERVKHLLVEAQQRRKNRSILSKYKIIHHLFSRATTEERNKILTRMPKADRDFLIRMYGENFDQRIKSDNITQEELNKLAKIERMITYYMKTPVVTLPLIFTEVYTKKERDEILGALSMNDIAYLKYLYGQNLDTPVPRTNLSEDEKRHKRDIIERIKIIITKKENGEKIAVVEDPKISTKKESPFASKTPQEMVAILGSMTKEELTFLKKVSVMQNFDDLELTNQEHSLMKAIFKKFESKRSKLPKYFTSELPREVLTQILVRFTQEELALLKKVYGDELNRVTNVKLTKEEQIIKNRCMVKLSYYYKRFKSGKKIQKRSINQQLRKILNNDMFQELAKTSSEEEIIITALYIGVSLSIDEIAKLFEGKKTVEEINNILNNELSKLKQVISDKKTLTKRIN